MISFQHKVKEEEINIRIDLLLSEYYPKESRSQIQRWIKNNFVKVNDKEIKPNYKCRKNDIIKGLIPAEKPMELIAENIALDIVYEDDDLIVINKPRGMVVHPSENHQSGTLVHALLHHTNELSTISGDHRPGIVHRIDKDTSGLLVVAKNNDIHTELIDQLKVNEFERYYEAIVHGEIGHESGLIDAPIGRDPKHRLRMDVVDQGKKATTYFQVIQRYINYTLVSCRLETGRTHQIRVHLNYINHPIIGDPKDRKSVV